MFKVSKKAAQAHRRIGGRINEVEVYLEYTADGFARLVYHDHDGDAIEIAKVQACPKKSFPELLRDAFPYVIQRNGRLYVEVSVCDAVRVTFYLATAHPDYEIKVRVLADVSAEIANDGGEDYETGHYKIDVLLCEMNDTPVKSYGSKDLDTFRKDFIEPKVIEAYERENQPT